MTLVTATRLGDPVPPENMSLDPYSRSQSELLEDLLKLRHNALSAVGL